MTTPADRYAAFRDRKADPELAGFRALYDFDFDPFQVEACRALGAGHGVLVAAPTGSGKTVIGEYAVHLALAQGRKCFYTTPIKALSNQKYADLVRRYDSRTVGLLTGDNSINGDAPVVVMTTEVLRNMLYTGSLALSGLGYVVLDEVHYLADRSRGAVWEEVIIHLPESVRVVALSATVSNAEEFGEWLDQVRGGTEVIVDEHRPVPLWQHVLAGHRLYDLFTDDEHTTGQSRAAAGGPAGHLDRAQGPATTRPRRTPAAPVPACLPARRDLAARLQRPAARDHVHLQPGRLRRGGRAVPGRGAAADHAGRGRGDPAGRRAAHRGHPAGGPDRARLRRVAGRAAARHRGAPRRHAACLQGGGRGTVRGRPGPRGLRDRDPRARHQHAGQDRGHREAGQVERRDPREPDRGGVHPAHRAGWPPRHRRRGPRGGALAARHGPRRGGRPGQHPYLPAELELPALLQHGRQPDRLGRPGPRRYLARVLVRAIPGRPRRHRADPAGPQEPPGHGRAGRRDELR